MKKIPAIISLKNIQLHNSSDWKAIGMIESVKSIIDKNDSSPAAVVAQQLYNCCADGSALHLAGKNGRMNVSIRAQYSYGLRVLPSSLHLCIHTKQ